MSNLRRIRKHLTQSLFFVERLALSGMPRAYSRLRRPSLWTVKALIWAFAVEPYLSSVSGPSPCTRPSAHIYLIDVASIPLKHLRPVFDLLASSDVTKVVWDGRMDYSALYHDYGVRMRNVIDLQIVDILSRDSRDTPKQHLKR